MRRNVAVWVRLLALVFMACGKSSSETAGGGSHRHPYCTSIPPTYCETYVTCCNEAGYEVTTDECEEYLVSDCEEQVDAALAKGWRYDTDAAENCDLRILEIVESCSYLSPYHQIRSHLEHVCRAVWSGDGPAGSSCTRESDCFHETGVVTSCLRPYLGGASGVCTIDEVSFIGDPCDAASLRTCMPGLYCRQASERCAVLLLAGDFCSTHEECAGGDCANGMCGSVGREGTSCVDDADCGSDYCENGACRLEPVASPELCSFGRPREGAVRAGRVASPGRFANP